jgi:SAM-dependent methyltransferase
MAPSPQIPSSRVREDAQRWNERYAQEFRDSFARPRPFLLQSAHHLPASGLALDAAMGLGGNAGFLLQRGLRVIGIDLSSVALHQAKARLPGLMAVLANLADFPLPPNSFDVIINFYYLERSLFSTYLQALRPRGILIFETLTIEMQTLRPDIDPQYLLQSGELCHAFRNMDIQFYNEGWQRLDSPHPRAVASLVARRPL